MSCCDGLRNEVNALRAEIRALKADLKKSSPKDLEAEVNRIVWTHPNWLTLMGGMVIMGSGLQAATAPLRGILGVGGLTGASIPGLAGGAVAGAGPATTAAVGGFARGLGAILGTVVGAIGAIAAAGIGVGAVKAGERNQTVLQRQIDALAASISSVLGRVQANRNLINQQRDQTTALSRSIAVSQTIQDSHLSRLDAAMSVVHVDAYQARTTAEQTQRSVTAVEIIVNGVKTDAYQARTTAESAAGLANSLEHGMQRAITTATAAQATANTALSRPIPQPVTNIYRPTQTIVQPTREVVRQETVVQTNTVREVVRQETVVQTNTVQSRVIQETREVPINMAVFASAIAQATDEARQAKDRAIGAAIAADRARTAADAATTAATGAQSAARAAADAIPGVAGDARAAANAGSQAATVAQTAVTEIAKVQSKMDQQWQKLKGVMAKADILGALNLFVTLHNAAMLSRNLVDTLAQVVSNGLAIAGVRDADGNAIDFGSVIGRSANSFMETILGAEVWANTKTTWNQASRTYQAAAGIAWGVVSIADVSRSVAEWSATNISFIGNALRKDGVVSEDAYPPMSTQPSRFSGAQSRIDSLIEGLDRADGAAGSLAMVTGDIRSGQEEITQLFEQRQEFENQLEALKTEAQELEDSIKTDSTAPAITESDRAKAP